MILILLFLSSLITHISYSSSNIINIQPANIHYVKYSQHPLIENDTTPNTYGSSHYILVETDRDGIIIENKRIALYPEQDDEMDVTMHQQYSHSCPAACAVGFSFCTILSVMGFFIFSHP